MPNPASEITIVIPTYSRTDLLEECLESLAQQTFKEFETVVVDDGSERGVPEAVLAALPGTVVIRRERNGGFARAVNTGIRSAATPFIFLLNDDMTLAQDCLAKLLLAIKETGAAMAGPLVLFREERETVYCLGDRILASGRAECIGFRTRLRDFRMDEGPFGISAGAVLVRREVFDTIGDFDESFSTYFSDADLCFRARAAGFNVTAVPAAVAYHVGSATFEGRGLTRTRQCCRNHVLLVIKNYPARLLARHAFKIAGEHAHQCRRVVSSARTEFGLVRALGVLVRTWWSTLAALPFALIARLRIQRARTLPVSAIEHLLTE